MKGYSGVNQLFQRQWSSDLQACWATLRGSNRVPRHRCEEQAGQDLRPDEGSLDELRNPIALITFGKIADGFSRVYARKSEFY